MKTSKQRRRVVMRPAWRHLLFLHWEIAPDALRPFIPEALDIDLFEGRAYIGLVPFTMQHLRPRGLPHLPPLRRWHEDFHEVNVRTYVTHPKWGPGVWFFSLDAASASAVCAARLWYKLPYFYATMHLKAHRKNGNIIYDYFSQRHWPQPAPAGCAITYAPLGTPAPAVSGTLEHFLVERYWLYSYSKGRLFAGQVRHKPYPLQNAQVLHLEENLIKAAGFIRPNIAPLAHYAHGVQVDIFPPQRVY
jgi:uncharacterized protein YqjF (DUF2071 family)